MFSFVGRCVLVLNATSVTEPLDGYFYLFRCEISHSDTEFQFQNAKSKLFAVIF